MLNAVGLHYNLPLYWIDTSIKRSPALQFQTFAKLRRSTKQVESAKSTSTPVNPQWKISALQAPVDPSVSEIEANVGPNPQNATKHWRTWQDSAPRRLVAKMSKLSVLPLGFGQEFCKVDQQERATSSGTTRSVLFVHHIWIIFTWKRGQQGFWIGRESQAEVKSQIGRNPQISSLNVVGTSEEIQKILSSSVLDRCSSMGWSVPSDTSAEKLENLSF